jgi:hypothetical protein
VVIAMSRWQTERDERPVARVDGSWRRGAQLHGDERCEGEDGMLSVCYGVF